MVKNLKPMFKKRGCFSAAFANPYVYVFGGINYTEKVLKDCERLDMTTGTWESISSMGHF